MLRMFRLCSLHGCSNASILHANDKVTAIRSFFTDLVDARENRILENQNFVRYQNVIVMRHGDRIDNLDHSWASTASRPWDPPLAQAGRVRAYQTGLRIRQSIGFPIHRVFVSPFLRCVQTASEVVAALSTIDHSKALLGYSTSPAAPAETPATPFPPPADTPPSTTPPSASPPPRSTDTPPAPPSKTTPRHHATIASIKHNLSSHSIREEREKGEEREKEEEKVTVAIAATATTIATVNNRSSIDFKCRCNHPEHQTQPLSSLRSERRREERRRPSSPSLQPPLPPSPPPSSPSTTDPASPNADATTASIELNPRAAFDQREKEREKGGEDHRRHRYNRHYHRHRHHRQQHIQHRADVNIATNLMDLMVVLKPTDVGGDGSDVSVEYGLCEMMNKKAIRLDVAPKDGNWGLGISESEAMLPAEAVDTNVERMYKELPKWEEPFLQARARYQQIFKDLANKYIAENLLLVTHGEGVDVALSSLKKEATVYEVQYCAYVELRRPVFEKDETFTTGEFDVFSNSGETGISYRGGS
ncbi:hypothetical protein RIF29_29892 [Crotalaria pallida]|uniref:Uncharacterized protein n=1 Tax=Crotalaria pallida TaxID=3830 RepID=A0AAN9EG87_CROPI